MHFANTDVCNDSWRGTRGTSAFFVLMTRSRIGANCFNGLDCIQCSRELCPTSPPYRTLSRRFARHEFTRWSPTILSPIEKAREKKWADEEAGMWSQFQQREALTEQTVVDRKVLADNNIIRINKETRQKIKGTESEWQGRASKWLATARRKVSLHAGVVLVIWLRFATSISTPLRQSAFNRVPRAKASCQLVRLTRTD